MSILAVHPGAYYHIESFEAPRYAGYFDRLARPVSALADALERKRHEPRWESRPSARLVLDVAMLARLAVDLSA